MQADNELKTWAVAAVVVILTATSVFFSQRFVGRFFDIAFEICIFYIPAFASLMLYLYFRKKR